MRNYSLAYLTAAHSSVTEAIDIAAELGYSSVGLRLWPNAAGAPHQRLLGEPALLREALARLRASDVQVFDLEIIRIGADFDARLYQPLFDIGAALGARAILVAGDDPQDTRLASHYAQLCAALRPYGMSADLEFMPWTAVPHAQAAMHILNLAGQPDNAGILVDALHYGRSRTSLADIAALPEQTLHYAQICDAQPGLEFSTEQMIYTARQERALPGEGAIDLKGLFNRLPRQLPISVEVPNLVRAQALGDKAWAKLALDAAQAVLG